MTMNHDIIEDGFGNTWARCQLPDCDLHVVRPGKVQCSNCNVQELRAERQMLRETLHGFATAVLEAQTQGRDSVTLSLSSDAVARLVSLLESDLLPGFEYGAVTGECKVTNDSEPVAQRCCGNQGGGPKC